MQQGKVYYRLQSVDKDGKAQYSHLVSIERKGTTSYYPNPITNTLTIQQPTPQTATYTLYNTLGEVVSKGSFDTPTHTIPVSHLPVGMYYLQVNGVSFKVMKQ
ncbi:MAG TPA: T9SS type A sorting domain-containing protein [Chitinophagales bacterium]|nr:T9SS type A sorting domain-containing protein [Chitinophagales bacterium]